MPESSPEVEDKAEAKVEQTETAKSETEIADAKSPAESSTADPKDEKGDMLTAVKAALEPKTEKSSDSKTEGSKADEPDKPAEKDGEKSGDEADDLTEEELARLRPKTRKRIENLVQDVKERDTKIADLEPKAQRFEQLVRFVDDAGLSPDEVNRGFDVMRDLKNDPLKAYGVLRPIMDQLELLVGQKLPDDLQVAVNQGQITEPHARELARARSTSAVREQQLQRRDQQDQHRQARQAFEDQQTQVSTAVAKWESSKAGSDPDWKQKQARVMELVELETLRRTQQNPRFVWTPDEAVKFADVTLKRVNEELQKLAPKPKAVNPVTDVASGRSISKPKTALEAAKAGLAAMTAA